MGNKSLVGIAIVDNLNQVNESNETNNNATVIVPAPPFCGDGICNGNETCSTCQQDCGPCPTPDLIVQDITWSPENPTPGTAVPVTLWVKNIGNAAAATSDTRLFVDGAYAGQVTTPPLAPSQVYFANFTYNVTASPNPHTLIGAADFGGPLQESNESNNNRTEQMYVGQTAQPDLIINSITWTPLNPVPNQATAVTFTVKNIGDATAGASTTLAKIDNSIIGYVSTPSLAPGATYDFTRNVPPPAMPNPHTLSAAADYYNNVSESNEANNNRTEYMYLSFPDYIVEDIFWSPENPTPGTAVPVILRVKNIGNATATNTSYSRLAVDGAYIGDVTTPPLAPSEVYLANFTYNVTASPNPHTLLGMSDFGNRVQESIELNNNLTEQMYMINTVCGNGVCEYNENCSNCQQDCGPCPMPDLIIIRMGYSPSSPSPGTRVSVYSDIKNIGNATASGFTTRTTINPQGTVCNNWIGSLNSGQTYRVYCNYTAGNISSTASTYADINNQVQESNEYNNGMNITIPVTCTPMWYCYNKTMRAYQNSSCQVTYSSCPYHYCCKNGQCYRDPSGKCLGDVAVAEDAMAQVQGPNLIPENVPDLQMLNVAAAFCLASLAAIIFHAFMKIEAHI